MSTQSMSKNIRVSALVALPFPFLLLVALEASSGLPGNQGAMTFLATEQGPVFYVVSWFVFVIAAVLSVSLVSPARRALVQAGGDKSSYDNVPGGEVRGTVKWFNVSKGFGFITTDEGEDVFVHFRCIRGSGRRSLSQGQSVRFDLSEGEKGIQAENVSVVS